MKLSVAKRRHPFATAAVLFLALLVTGGAYTLTMGTPANATEASIKGDAERGYALFQSNCATCHGPQAAGRENIAPSLVGVGAASVDFQVATGRMPMAAQGVQAPRKGKTFTEQDTADMAAWVATLGPGPSIPDAKYLEVLEDSEAIAEGGEIFRINCAMCHNVVGSGGALTRGKVAPKVTDVDAQHIYEAMSTGPQSMPVFSDANISPEDKQKVISYIKTIESKPSPGGFALGSLGPVSEGLFAWIGGITILIGFAIWLGAKSV